MDINKLRDEAYRIACEHGWHDDKELSDEHWLMLIITELAESVEADRTSKRAHITQYKDLEAYALREEMLHGEMLDRYLKEAFENEIKDSVEDELADIVIRCLDLAGLRQIKLPDELHPSAQMINRIKQISFTEWAYKVSGIITENLIPLESAITLVMLNVYAKAMAIGADIEWHVKTKINYNKTREYKHGKNY